MQLFDTWVAVQTFTSNCSAFDRKQNDIRKPFYCIRAYIAYWQGDRSPDEIVAKHILL